MLSLTRSRSVDALSSFPTNSLSDGIHTAYNDHTHSIYIEKLANGNFSFTDMNYDLPKSCSKFKDVYEENYGAETNLRQVVKKMGINPLYIYACDSQGRVLGERLSSDALLTDYDRVLVVGQYQDHYLRFKKSNL